MTAPEMSAPEPAAPEPAPPEPAAENSTAAPPPEASAGEAPAPPGGEARVHLYEAVSNQREKVLTGFDVQREAILKAVADQREAALAPIRQVNARQNPTAGVDGRVLGARGAGQSPAQAPIDRNQVLAEIAQTIRALIADEVRLQIVALLTAADAKMRGEPPAA